MRQALRNGVLLLLNLALVGGRSSVQTELTSDEKIKSVSKTEY
jgi:hypothetical protein